VLVRQVAYEKSTLFANTRRQTKTLEGSKTRKEKRSEPSGMKQMWKGNALLPRGRRREETPSSSGSF
jgi:hypothetical protein